MKESYALLNALLLSCTLLFSCAKEEKPVPPAEFYLVVDTSGSMATGTMKMVKEKLPAIMTSVRQGDTVHLIQFDEKAHSVGDFTIQSDADRTALETAILNLKPSGAYTDIKQLIAHLKSNVQPANPESPQYIIVLSDGIDDPRPGKKTRKDRVKLQEFESADKLPVQEPYIFYIKLGEKSTQAAEENLKEDLKEISSEVKVVKPTGEGDAGLDQVQKDIDSTRPPEEPSWWQKIWMQIKALPLWIWGIVAAALLLLGFILYRSFREIRPLEGILAFYESADHPSMAREINLHKFRRDDLTIGAGVGSIIRIKDNTFPAQIRLKAKRAGKEFLLRPAKKDLQRMEFLVQKKRGFISSGDRFRINNYTFEYSHGTKK